MRYQRDRGYNGFRGTCHWTFMADKHGNTHCTMQSISVHSCGTPTEWQNRYTRWLLPLETITVLQTSLDMIGTLTPCLWSKISTLFECSTSIAWLGKREPDNRNSTVPWTRDTMEALLLAFFTSELCKRKTVTSMLYHLTPAYEAWQNTKHAWTPSQKETALVLPAA
jgi:hypothetical protein